MLIAEIMKEHSSSKSSQYRNIEIVVPSIAEENYTGFKVRRRRELLNVDIKDLACQLGVEVLAVEKLETRKRIAFKLLKKIACALQITVPDITELSEDEFRYKHRNKNCDYVNSRIIIAEDPEL